MRYKLTGIICLVLSVVLIGIGAYLFVPRLLDYKASRDLYRTIADDYTKDPEPAAETELPMESEGQPVQEDRPSGVKTLDSLLAEIIPGEDTAAYQCIDVDGEGLLEKNEDYIGWIYIPKTDISYPVVLSKDNVDYLHTNFEKGYSFAGTIFEDCRCTKGVFNHHAILYGHNMRDGSMFAGLHGYMEQEFADNHPVFWFITPKYRLLYQVFAACSADPYDKVQYGVDGADYQDNGEFEDAIREMVEESAVDMDKQPDGDDFIMTLSTCTGDSSVRHAVHGVLLGAYEPVADAE